MTVLLDETFPRTIDELTRDLADDEVRGARVEAWLFEGAAARRAAEERLATAAVNARVRSAYKPLVHFFLEDVDTRELRRATIAYPVREPAPEGRFLVEAYPLAALLSEVETRFVPGGPAPVYRVELEYRNGTATHEVFVPNDVRIDHLGERRLSPTGWLRIAGSRGGVRDTDRRLETEYEKIFRRAVEAIQSHPWRAQEPQFEQLVIRAEIPPGERRLPVGEECISTAEAMHEDLYFSVLEVFKHRAGRTVDDRKTRPGQIIPDVRYTDGVPRARVAVEPFAAAEPAQPAPVALDAADRAPSLAQVHAELAAIGGRPFSAVSRQGRTVPGVYRAGTRPAIVVTAGQHANETSGVVGALRAARRLADAPGAHFALIPVENPDGYTLHRQLCAVHPRHMHHAARYTAFGDDLQSRTEEPWNEKAARLEAFRLSGATLHINLHGYPAHEWSRPLTGYLPRGFDAFAIPKGFYLIVRHHASWAARAESFRTQLTERLARIPDLVALNRAQLAGYGAHAGAPPFPLYHDLPVQTVEDDRAATPLTLITEFPDETIYGDLFALAQTVQMQTVLAAEEIHAALDRAR